MDCGIPNPGLYPTFSVHLTFVFLERSVFFAFHLFLAKTALLALGLQKGALILLQERAMLPTLITHNTGDTQW